MRLLGKFQSVVSCILYWAWGKECGTNWFTSPETGSHLLDAIAILDAV